MGQRKPKAFPAQFDGTCEACGDEILTGDLIVRGDDDGRSVWLHGDEEHECWEEWHGEG